MNEEGFATLNLTYRRSLRPHFQSKRNIHQDSANSPTHCSHCCLIERISKELASRFDPIRNGKLDRAISIPIAALITITIGSCGLASTVVPSAYKVSKTAIRYISAYPHGFLETCSSRSRKSWQEIAVESCESSRYRCYKPDRYLVLKSRSNSRGYDRTCSKILKSHLHSLPAQSD